MCDSWREHRKTLLALGLHNVINENGGTGFLQERGDTNDTIINSGTYTVAAN